MLFYWFGNCAPPFRPIKLKVKTNMSLNPALEEVVCVYLEFPTASLMISAINTRIAHKEIY